MRGVKQEWETGAHYIVIPVSSTGGKRESHWWRGGRRIFSSGILSECSGWVRAGEGWEGRV